MPDAQALQELRRMVNTANEQFNGWARGNRAVISRLEATASDPERLRFRQVEDEAPMPIPGMSEGVTLHGYQNAYVRKTSREFGGINGFGVGLGKTFTALAATQYAQSIGVKKKTLFVVPNSVLSNWRKEAMRAYSSTDDCLFVGLRIAKDGRATISSSNFDADLTAVMENRHSKIFMTLEAFERIRMRDETISEYEAFMRRADASFSESMDKKEDERAKSKQAGLLSILSDKRGSAPYIEDMGVDSVVFDEAHCFPAGTLIDGIPIETIKVGDLVRSVNHETGQIEFRCVTDVMKRRPSGLVRVHLSDGRSIVCTHDHPFFVQYLGYVAAEFLNSGYNLYVNYSETVQSHEMQSLRNGVPADQGSDLAGEAGRPGVLLDGVCNRVAEEEGSAVSGLRAVRKELRAEPCAELEGGNGQDGSVLLQSGVCNAVETRQFGGAENVTEQREQAQQGSGSAGTEQLAANAGGRGEEPAGATCPEVEQPEDQQAGRQRCGHGRSAEDACGCAAMAGRVCCYDGRNQGEREAVSLPAGHGAPGIEDCRGGGWPLAQLGEGQGIGRAEGCVSGFVGVDRVEVLEHGGDGRFSGLCPDGYVYDVTVAGNHNFFAEGILVHNCFKNSAQTVDFKGAKFLSMSPASKRGIDAQAKAWFIRGQSPLKDGVLMLTATPITNSPLEMYAMLSLAVGHERVNDLCLGIKGADNFMEMMCVKENQDDVTMDGVARTTDVFVGLNNVGVLRKSIGEVATIKSAADVGGQIIVPEREEKPTPVTLPDAVVERLKLYKSAFRYAIDELAEKSPNRGDPEAYDQVAQHFGEELNLIGHPFNLINKMTMLIADPELDQRASFYSYLSTQADKAKQAIEQFNARKITEERPRPGPMTDESAIVGKKKVKDSGGNETELLKIEVRARAIDGGRVVIDSIDPDVQSAFEAIADKIGLDLDVSVPPKLAAMLENFQNEQASPRGIDASGKATSVVKQIVFCDILPLHNKIKRLLTRRAGVPSSAIAIITGRTNNTPDEILAVQDGFNGVGEDSKYQTVIANEKAEVGINLQKGTQAIHHLTIGWTPDSLEQRNGRGVRQGNATERVNLYYYDADGTFDTSKRSMVNKKADWIGQVMDVNGTGSVSVAGGLSREQMEALIDVVGDVDAMRRMQETIAAKEAESRASNNRDRQMINLDTIRKQNTFLNDNRAADSFVIRKIIGLFGLERQADKLRDRIANPKATATAVARNESLLAELMASIGGLRRQIEESATLHRSQWSGGGQTKEPATLDSFFAAVRSGKKQKDDDIEAMLRGRSYPSFGLEIVEGGPITNEWQAEVDMAESMIEEAKAAFARQAEEAGGYPADVAEAIARGDGVVYNGKPLTHGTFVRVAGGLAVLALENGRPRAFGRSMDGSPLAADTSAVMAGEWIYRGTAGYDSCLTDAAQIEDIINGDGRIENGFNTVVPEVAQRRKVEALAAYRVFEYRLPQPYFPYVVVPTDADKSEVQRSIFESQKAVVRSFDGGSFVVAGDVAVERANSRSDDRFKLLREYAVAHGMKLTVADFYGNPMWVQRQIEETVTVDALKAALTGNTEHDIREQAAAFVRGATGWFDWEGKDTSDYLPYEFRIAIVNAGRKAMAGTEQPSSQSPNDVVGIRGNTMDWKDTIKSCAVRAGAGKYKWDKRSLSWNVYRSTWDYLVANYPKAAEQLELIGATRSL